jgi:hypothetical protein
MWRRRPASVCVWVFRNRSMHMSPDPNRSCEVWMAGARRSQARTMLASGSAWLCASCTSALCEESESESDSVPLSCSSSLPLLSSGCLFYCISLCTLHKSFRQMHKSVPLSRCLTRIYTARLKISLSDQK